MLPVTMKLYSVFHVTPIRIFVSSTLLFVCCTLAMLGLPRLSYGQLADDGFNPDADNEVLALAVQPDGKIVVGGKFTTLGGQPRSRIGRLNPDGSLDPTFNPGANNNVEALAIQPDGKILVGGSFITLGGQSRNRIGRLNPDGSVDSTFDPNADNTIRAIAVQADGKIVIGGVFTVLGGQLRSNIARVNSSGSLDTTFDPGTDGSVRAVVIQANGKIVVSGFFTTLGGQIRNRLGRLNADGSLDTTFNPNSSGSIRTIAIQGDGKLVVGGSFSLLGGQTHPRVGRINANGSIDTTFNPSAGTTGNTVYAVAVQTDGKIVVSGDFTTLGDQPRNRIGRLHPDGSLDTTFNPDATHSDITQLADVRLVTVQLDGKLIVGGLFTLLGGQTRNRIARLHPDGSLDMTFNPGADAAVRAVAVGTDGKVVVGGEFTLLGGQTRNGIGRLNADGTLETTFNPGANGVVYALAMQKDGKTIVGGGFTTLGGETRNYLGRLNVNGSLDPTFDAGQINGAIRALAVQADGKVIVGGEFTMLDGQARNRIGRLNADGSLDDTFDPNANGPVYTLAIQADGKVIVGGDFTVLGGQTRNGIGRCNADNGTLDAAFDPNANGPVRTLTLQADGKVIVGGEFTNVGGQLRARLGRLNVNGGLDMTFNPGASNTVYALTVQTDGKVVVGGEFTALGGQTRNGLGRLNSDGNLDPTFNPGADSTVYALNLQADGKVVVGGNFTLLGSQTRNAVGRLSNETTARQHLQVDTAGTVVTWLREGSSPEVGRVSVEQSLDGVSWISLGAATRITDGWQRTGLFIPAGVPVYIRTQGFTTSGGSVYESVQRVFLPADVTTSLGSFPALATAGSVVSGTVNYRNVGAALAAGMTYSLTLNTGLSGVTLVCTNGVTASYTNTTGVVTFAGAPPTLNPGQVFSCALSYTAPGGGTVVVDSQISTTTVQGANTVPDSANVTTVIRPSLIIGNVTAAEGNSGTTNFALALTLSGPSVAAVTVNYATANGSALAGSDYTTVSGTITFTAGQTVKTITVPVLANTVVEPNETFVVNLSNAVNVVIADGQGVGTINNDDGTALAITNASANEGHSGTTNLVFTVNLSNPSANAVSVNYATANGSAAGGSDYTTTSGTLTFAAGQLSKTIIVPLRGDLVVEPSETFFMNLSGVAGATIADGQGLGTIVNDDGTTLRINDVTRSEGSSSAAVATFTVTLSSPSATQVTVNYATANGSATAGSDYLAANGSVVFAPGQISKTIAVTVTGDTAREPNETFVVNLSAATGATLFDSQGVGTIRNDDGPVLRITDVARAEGNSGTTPFTFTVTLSPASTGTVTVKYATANYSALAGPDYTATSGTLTFAPGQTSKTVTVNVVGNPTVEPNEAFLVNLSTATGATLFDSQGVGTILNDDGPVLRITDVARAEGNSGTTPFTFTVTLSPASTGTVTVKYATANYSALAGPDYTATSGTLTFAPGQTSKTVTVNVVGNPTREANEAFLVNLSAATGATLFDSQGVGTILNDDGPVLRITDVARAEGNSGTTPFTFTVTLSPASTGTVTVKYATANGSALAGSDYTVTSGTLTFTPGQTSKTMTVNVMGNPTREANEAFLVNLSAATGATLFDSQGVGTILNDDGPVLRITDVARAEGNSGTTPFTFTVTLSPASTGTVTVKYATANYSALTGSDYTATSGTLTFAPGQTSKTVTVNVVGNPTREANEAFLVNLSTATGATLFDSQGVGAILNDD